MANKNNSKASENNVSRETLNLTLSKDSTLSLFSDMLTSKHNAIEEFNGKEMEVFKFTVNKGKEVTTIVVRDKASVAALTNIEKSARLQGATATLICSEMRKIPKSTIEKSGLSALNFFKGAFGDVLSDNTISRYFRISRLFFDPNTYQYRKGLEVDTLVSNLDVVLPLFKFKERNIKIEDLSEEEIEKEYNAFFEEYIIKDIIHLFKSQSQLKEEVSKANKGIIDEKKKDNGNVENGKAENGNAENGNVENGNVENGNAENGKAENGNAENGNAENGKAENVNNFDKIAESIAIIRQLLDDEEIKAKFDDVVAYIEETLA